MARILVVDDEPEIADAVAARLGSEGHTAILASDGEQALSCVECRLPDLVILDLTLPGLDGVEVCRRIHRIAPVPVLMLTARNEEADIVLGLEVGADDYLTRGLSGLSTSSLRLVSVSAAPQAPQPKQRHYHMGRLRLVGRSARAS